MPAPRHHAADPTQWEADVVLRDGSTAHVRPIRPSDAAATARMHDAQSERSIYLRYFTYKSHLSEKELKRFTEVDHVDRVALVVTLGDEIIAIGRFDRLPDPTRAEVAFNVRDAFQGKGLGSILLEHLAAAGRDLGIERFTAEVLPENRQMLTVFSEAGYDVARHFEDGIVAVEFDIDPTERSVAVMEAREHRAEARSLAELLHPRSVAVVGASRRAGTVGATVLEHVQDGGFEGPVYAVNPKALELGGGLAYARVSDIKSPVDLAIVAVPKDQVLSVARDCAAHGVKGMVILTAGFLDDTDLTLQREVVRLARANGMRVIGPASLGLVNTSAEVRLNASMSPDLPAAGSLGLFTQSAALGSMLDALLRRRGVGVSAWVNAGNRADVSGNDLMQYFEDDAATSVVGLYLESFGNPRKFSRIASRLSRAKPVIVAKSDVMGLRLPPGHEVLTTQAPLGAVDAMLRQSGVIRVGTQEELVDVAELLTAQPLPAGARVAVLSNSPAFAAVAADQLITRRLTVTAVRDDVLLAGSTRAASGRLTQALAELGEREDVDAVLLALLPAVGPDARALAVAVGSVLEAKPVLACFAGTTGADAPVAGLVGSTPCYPGLAQAAAALRHAVTYRAWKERDPGEANVPEGVDRERAERLLEAWAEDLQGAALRTLTDAEAQELLSCYGLGLVSSVPFETADEAAEAAREIGYPVALKARDELLRHRLDLGGVRLNIEDEASLRRDVASMHSTLASYGPVRLEVQAMAPTGQGCVVRAVEDPLMGPLLSFGLSGDAVTLLDDWAHAIPPLTPGVVADMVQEPRAAPKLFGHQGLPVLDTAALQDLLVRVGWLKDDLPGVALLEFHPVLVSRRGAVVLHATVQVGDAARRADSARRAMSIPRR